MTDPIADAVAQIDAAPSRTEPSLLERANETIHELEAKLEHFIHPAGTETDSNSMGAALAMASTAGTEAANDPQSAVGKPEVTDSSAPTNSSEPLAQTLPETSAESAATPVASTDAPEGTGESPNAAPVVAEPSASDISSSASPALPEGGTPVVSVSEDVGKAVRERIQAIKGHLAGFEVSVVAKIHAELEGIERLL